MPTKVTTTQASRFGTNQLSITCARPRVFNPPRAAKARGISEATLRALIAKHTEHHQLSFLVEPRVNVLALNVDLDEKD